MSKSGIKWLYQELPDLTARGILSQESADKLRQHYGQVKSITKTSAMLIILGTLGAFLIGLGIILLLAHNWEQFSRLTRGILSFAPLVLGQGLALWVLKNRPASGAFKEACATFLSLMVVASLSLISQTYNITADADTFILTWMFLIIPLTYLMQASLPAAIYLIGITVWSGMQYSDTLKAFFFWPLIALVLPHLLWSLRQEAYALRTAWLALIMIICVSFGASFTLGQTWSGSWVVIFPSLYALFYLAGCLRINQATTLWQKPLRLVGSVGLFILAFIFTFRPAWQYLGSFAYLMPRSVYDLSALPDHLATMALVVLAILLFYDNVKADRSTAALFGALPLLAITAYLLHDRSGVIPALIFNAYIFILSIHHIATGYRSGNLSVINTGMLMLAILILARFFDSDISFVAKGLAFIAIGIGFLVVNLKLARRWGGKNEK
jgi:uncharacterized membrane protein